MYSFLVISPLSNNSRGPLIAETEFSQVSLAEKFIKKSLASGDLFGGLRLRKIVRSLLRCDVWSAHEALAHLEYHPPGSPAGQSDANALSRSLVDCSQIELFDVIFL